MNNIEFEKFNPVGYSDEWSGICIYAPATTTAQELAGYINGFNAKTEKILFYICWGIDKFFRFKYTGQELSDIAKEISDKIS